MRYLVIAAHHPGLSNRDHWFFIPITEEGQLTMADRADDFIFNRRMTPWDPIEGIVYNTEVVICEYINRGWIALWPARHRPRSSGPSIPSLDLDLQFDPLMQAVIEPSEEDQAKLESRMQPAKFKIYAPLEDYDIDDGDKGLYVRWDTWVGAPSVDMYFQAYEDWPLLDYWKATGGYPPLESGSRYFEKW